jgi:hypothetical protein
MLQLEKISPYVRKKFILLLTKELIKIWKQNLEKHLITPETPKKVVKSILKARRKTPHKLTRPIFKKLPKPQRRGMPPVLRIPETRLPTHLQTIKPASRQYSISVGKLDPLLNNPSIKVIECNGPDQNIIVRAPQTKQTDIKLTKQEIASILQGFSKTSGIPLNDGVNKIVIGNIALSAIISEVIGSKFIIKKGVIPQKRKNQIIF